MDYQPHHTAISVRSIERTLAFYQDFGFRQVHRYDDSDKVGVKLKLRDYVIEVFAFKSNQDKPALKGEMGNDLRKLGVKHLGFTTNDIDAALADLKRQGLANDETQILEKGVARFFFVQDPDGVWVEIIKDQRY
jgi:glyoxylase I family protein